MPTALRPCLKELWFVGVSGPPRLPACGSSVMPRELKTRRPVQDAKGPKPWPATSATTPFTKVSGHLCAALPLHVP